MKNTLSEDQIDTSKLQVHSAKATRIVNVCVGTT